MLGLMMPKEPDFSRSFWSKDRGKYNAPIRLIPHGPLSRGHAKSKVPVVREDEESLTDAIIRLATQYGRYG
jgi:hypothetical protein